MQAVSPLSETLMNTGESRFQFHIPTLDYFFKGGFSKSIKVELSGVDANKISKIIKWCEKRAKTLENTMFFEESKKDDSVEIDGRIISKKIKTPIKKLSQEEMDTIILKYEDGESTYMLAEEYGVHRETVSRCLKRHEITRTKQKLKLSALTKTIANHYESGKTMAWIAEEMSVSKHVVQYHVKKAGLSTRTRWDY